MFGSLPSCLRRHKKKLFFVGGVIGGIAFLNTYLKRKLIEWETQRTADICDQLRRSNHFEETMHKCDSVFRDFAPEIRKVVCKTVDVNLVVKQVGQNPPNKIQLWEELKILVFTQALGELYAQCLLCILLRVQMSVLSGYVFVSRCTNSNATEQRNKYMSRIQDFILNGINKVLVRVRRAVEENLKETPLQRPLLFKDVEKIVMNIKNSMFQDDDSFFQDISCYLMPASSSTAQYDEFLETISLETRDVIECQDFSKVLHLCIDLGVTSLMDRISECYVILCDDKDGFVNPHDLAIAMAKLIPIMHNVVCQHQPTEQGSIVHTLLQLESLNNFAANIYEAFSHKCSVK